MHPLAFNEIPHWPWGQGHDHRPLLRLEHPPVPDTGHAAAHRFLWFEWGHAERLVSHTTTTLGFAKNTDPILVAIREGLEWNGVPPDEPFVVRREGTRDARIQGARYLRRARRGWELPKPPRP